MEGNHDRMVPNNNRKNYVSDLDVGVDDKLQDRRCKFIMPRKKRQISTQGLQLNERCLFIPFCLVLVFDLSKHLEHGSEPPWGCSKDNTAVRLGELVKITPSEAYRTAGR